MMEMKEDVYNEDGEKVDESPIYETFEKAVEDVGDGTGQFLWPRQQRRDGKWFGFDARILAQKRGKYLDKMQFRAQYYNNPQDPDNERISAANFQYYEPRLLRRDEGYWTYNGNRLNLTASIDFAYSIRKTADYTAIVVVGVDSDNNIYVLDIDRFKTSDIGEYFQHILQLHNKWDFRRLAAEVTAAQQAIVKSLKQDYIAPHGLAIKVEDVRPTRNQGSKEERIEAILGPRYDNKQIFHYRGGNTQVLEEELVLQNPPHDDVMDALATAIEKSVKPARAMRTRRTEGNVIWNQRFGGRSH
jgi:predicted phage terminase large subunit-like protein